MGLASKLAAAQGGQPPYPGGPGAGGPPAGQGGPPQQQYQAYNPNQGPPQGRGGPDFINMNKFGRVAAGTPANLIPGQGQSSASPYPAPLNVPPRTGSAQPPSAVQQQYQQYQPQPYPQGPAIPPRPSSAQPPYQQPAWGGQPQQQQQQFQQNVYQTAQSPHPQSFSPQIPQTNMHRPGTTPQFPQGSFQQSPYQPPGQSHAPNSYQGYQQGPPQGQYQQPYQQQQPYQPPGAGYPQGQPPYPGAPQQGGPQYQQGGYPPQGQQPQQGGGQNLGAYKSLLQGCIQEKGLQNFYPPNSPQLDQIAQKAAQQVQTLAAQWRVNPEIAQDIVKLALYDVILYVDDSGSMAFEENGERIDDLKLIINRVAFAAGLFDHDGIQVRFMNSNEQGNGITTQQQVEELISRIRFQGLTPMGRELQNKVLQPLVVNPARSNQLRKPVLVIVITDGQPTGESQRDISNIILSASRDLQANPRYGKGAVAFQFAQVGNDLKAREFLKQLDENREIGDIIDCTSNFEVEQDEMSRANPPVNLTPELWLIKLLLGSIDHSYDKKDEQTNTPQGGYGQQQGQYFNPNQGQGQHGPPPGQYGQPQGQHGPPQGQYGQQPPQGQYGGYQQQQQQGYPPQGRGGPPQGQGYPPQQGGYGGPPQPRY